MKHKSQKITHQSSVILRYKYKVSFHKIPF